VEKGNIYLHLSPCFQMFVLRALAVPSWSTTSSIIIDLNYENASIKNIAYLAFSQRMINMVYRSLVSVVVFPLTFVLS
jgi:hypothetical protein